MNAIEQQLWDYIDGNLDESQTKTMLEKINTNPIIKDQYEELLMLHRAFEKMEFEEPSMSFTRNVMESVALEPAPLALKTKVNIYIVYGIGGCFLAALLALIGYVLYYSNLQFSDFNTEMKFNINWNEFISPFTIYAFLFIDLVIGLVFLDYLLRKKVAPKSSL